MRSPRRVALGSILIAAALSGVTAAPKLSSSWAAPDLAPLPNQKFLVLALVSEDTTKRSLEDAVVAELKKKKVDAIPAYASLAAQDTESEEAIRAKARELGVNAGLVFKGTGVDTKTQATPSVSVGVGTGGYGMFGAFLGTSVPLGGGSKTVRIAGVKVDYYVADAEGPRWIGTYSLQIGDSTDRAASELASATVKQLRKVKGIK